MENPTASTSLLPTAPMGWFFLAVTVLLAVVGSQCIYLLWFHPASGFPGPKLAAVSNIYFVYYRLKGKYPWAIEALHKKYGPVVRVAPNELSFATLQAGNDVYVPTVEHHETWIKTDIMDFGTGDLGFIWETDPTKRRRVAKKIHPAFSAKAIRAKDPIVHHYVDLFVEKMKQRENVPDGIDLERWMYWLALDIAADLAYSREMHQLRDEEDSEFLRTMLGTNFYGTVTQSSKKIPLLRPFAIFFVPLKVIRLLPKFFELNRKEIQIRINRRGQTSHPDFMDYMLPPDSLPPQTEKEKIHLEQVALQLLMAGFDPMQLLFYSSIFFLLKNPEVYTKLTNIIRSVFQSYDEITTDAVSGIPYLHACIQEILRMFVFTSNGMPRRSPGSFVDGKYVPKGVVCQVSLFTIGRSSEYFHDPGNYHPERWLPQDHPEFDKKFSNDKTKEFFPFGLGPRACTGRQIAWSQGKLFLAKVLWTFDLEIASGQDSTFDKDFSAHLLWNKPRMLVRFKQRRNHG